MPEKAMKYFKEALEYNIKANNILAQAIRYNNIASAFKDMDMPDSAINYFNKSKQIFTKYGLYNYAATVNSNIGNVYTSQKKFDKAIKTYLYSIKIQKDNHLTTDLIKTYLKISDAYYLMKNYKKALFYIKKSKNIADSLNSIEDLSSTYLTMSKIYNKKGNNLLAYNYLKKYMELKDSIFNKENQKQINEFDIIYQTLKKENKIKLLEKEKSIDKLEIKNKNSAIKFQKIIIYSATAAIIAFILFMIILLKQIKAKNKANNLLKEKNEEINQQKEEITAQRDEISSQKTTLEKHIKIIENQKEVLTDSINYAQNIQNAVLPEIDYFKKIFPESFIFYRPKDIISGDFYWFKDFEFNNKNYRIVAAVDSTGHGVPGALMSMMGISFISEIFNKKTDLNNPAEIINILRKMVINSLKQKGNFGESKDGFDMALCIFNDTDNELYFAGANSNLKIIRKTNEQEIKADKIINKNNYTFFEIKGDKIPVGISRKINKSFNNHIIKIKNKDTVYIMSDGYVDQFSGEKLSKFKSKRFNDLLIKIQNLEMEKQKNIIITEFENWKKNNEQTDDILVIGIKY
jgi:serine phosphatase RsbU (regulator of sigma subunit)